MKLTGQPVSPSQRKYGEDDKEIQDRLETENLKIASACSKRGQECLKETGALTQTHLQQLPID